MKVGLLIMEDNYKEVFFGWYCDTCENKKKKEDESPCCECLSEPGNVDSHKPVYYKEKN